MGSFNVACSISNISLQCGDEAVYIPLEVNEFPYGIGDGNHMLIYPHCFYSPVALPLIGEYDDYGRLDLVEDDNLKLVKEHFKIESNDDIFDFDVKVFTSGMFVHKKIFDALSSVYYEDYSGKKKDTIDEKYGYEAQQKCLQTAVKEAEDSKAIWEEALTREGSMISKEDIQDSIDYYKDTPYWVRAGISNGTRFSFRDYKTFNDVYQPQILEGKFKDELETFVKFVDGMYAVNNFFFPAMNGCQFGNPYMGRLLHKTALDIEKATIKRQKENSL